MPKSYDRCVKKAKRKKGVKNAYAYCHKVKKRHDSKMKRRRKGGK